MQTKNLDVRMETMVGKKWQTYSPKMVVKNGVLYDWDRICKKNNQLNKHKERRNIGQQPVHLWILQGFPINKSGSPILRCSKRSTPSHIDPECTEWLKNIRWFFGKRESQISTAGVFSPVLNT